jgi:hypothetical protein
MTLVTIVMIDADLAGQDAAPVQACRVHPAPGALESDAGPQVRVTLSHAVKEPSQPALVRRAGIPTGLPYAAGRRYRGDRFSCSVPAPATSSRHLYTGHRQGSTQAAPSLAEGTPARRAFVPGAMRPPGFDAIVPPIDASAVVHTFVFSSRT